MPDAEDLRGIAELSFADTRQILARTNVAGLAAFAARRADDTNLHARSRVLGDRAACDECFVVRTSQKEEQTRHASSVTDKPYPSFLLGLGARGRTRSSFPASDGPLFLRYA